MQEILGGHNRHGGELYTYYRGRLRGVLASSPISFLNF